MAAVSIELKAVVADRALLPRSKRAFRLTAVPLISTQPAAASSLLPITGWSCHKQKVCRDKHNFVATKLLSRQAYFCGDEHVFVVTNICHKHCRDKHNSVAGSLVLSPQETSFVATDTCLSRQFFYFFIAATKMILMEALANDIFRPARLLDSVTKGLMRFRHRYKGVDEVGPTTGHTRIAIVVAVVVDIIIVVAIVVGMGGPGCQLPELFSQSERPSQ